MKKPTFLSKFLTMIVTFFLFCSVANAQNVTITGTVIGADDGLPLGGVTVLQKGTSNGVLSNSDGNYSITVPRNSTIAFSFLGMEAQEFVITDQRVINVVMESVTTMMDEIVVTALGISRDKKSLGFAVTEVSGDDIAMVKDLNIANSLSGRVSGVVVTQGAFGPGSSSRVIIRGNNSITGNNQPLYVVDGIPIDNSGYGTANVGEERGEYSKSDFGTGVSDLNPDDIESMSVLKGPNAAALYGSRASNGVILITTKKGSRNRGLGVTYSGNFTFETPMILPKYQNEYGQGTGGNITSIYDDLRTTGGSWGAKLDGSQQLYYNGDTRPYSPQPDNVKNFFETGSTLVNTLAIDGGTDKATLRFSYTNTTADAIVPGSKLDRHNFNLRGTANLTDKFNIDTKVTYFQQEGHNRPVLGTEGVLAYVYNEPRNVDFEDLKDYQNPADYSVKAVTNGSGNPYWSLLHDRNDDSRDRIQGFAKATYQFTDYLSAFVRIGTDVINEKLESVNQVGHWYFPSGRLNFSRSRITETNLDALLIFNKDLTAKITLDANVGVNHMYHTYERQGVYGENFKIPTKPTLESASNTIPSYTPMNEKIINSVYGSAVLSYDNFFFLEATARNDWSSALAPGYWSYFYPSVSGSVLLSELIDLPVMDYAKLRVSWAKVGSDTDPYQLQNAFNMSSAADSYLGLTILTRPSVRYNPHLKPEQTSSIEFGGEFRFFKNRLFTDISYYNIKSYNLIMNVPIPASTGYTSEHTNVGELRNKGFEILLGGIPVISKDFSWEVSMNMSTNKNELVELIEGLDSYTFSTTNSGVVMVQATVGGGYGDIYATTFKKNENGDIIVNAAGTYIVGDRELVGNYQPDWVGGLTNVLSYKGLTLRMLIDARIGGQIYSGTDAALDGSGTSERTLKYREGGVVIDGVVNTGTAENPVWTPNTVNITAQQYWGSYSGIGENYIYDQTNIRLREISLSYALPASLINKTFIKGVSLGITGRNLFFFYNAMENFDPETSYSVSNYSQGLMYYTLPTTRSLGLNLRLSF
jgi:TonB-linked SusC/RagA family outer membrane protein